MEHVDGVAEAIHDAVIEAILLVRSVKGDISNALSKDKLYILRQSKDQGKPKRVRDEI